MPRRPSTSRRFLALPVAFEANRGQLAPGTAFLAHGMGYRLALGRDGMAMGPVRMTLAGGHPAVPRGTDELPGKTNALIGSDPHRWETRVPMYGRVVYRHAWPGIDVAFHGTKGRPEYDLALRRGADVRAIALRFAGARPWLDAHGDLRAGPLREPRPTAFQDGRPVAARFVVAGDRVGLRVGPHDPHHPLTIDPMLAFSP